MKSISGKEVETEKSVSGAFGRRSFILAGMGIAAAAGMQGISSQLGGVSAAHASNGGWGGHTNGRIPLSALTPVLGTYLQADAAASFLQMREECRKATGVTIGIVEGYRDYDRQVKLYNDYKSGHGNEAAVPGTSNHGWGWAADLSNYSSPFNWLKDNARRWDWAWLGKDFRQTENWHWEYVGPIGKYSGSAYPARYGYIGKDGALWVKEGNPRAGWVQVASEVTHFDMSNDVVAIVSKGVASVKKGDLYGPWINLSGGGGVRQVVVDGDSYGFVTESGSFNAKVGLYEAWHHMADDVKKAQISGSRFGALTGNGNILVKEGIDSGWTVQAQGLDFDLASSRIGIVNSENTVYVKEGTLYDGWVGPMTVNNVKAVRLTPNRVGVLQLDGEVLVKEGSLYSGWVGSMSGNVSEISLSTNHVMVQRGYASVKDGDLYGAWVDLSPDGVKQVVVAN